MANEPQAKEGRSMIDKILDDGEQNTVTALKHANHPVSLEQFRVGAAISIGRMVMELQREDQGRKDSDKRIGGLLSGRIKLALHECAQYGMIPGRHCEILPFWSKRDGLYELKVHMNKSGVLELGHEHGVEIDVPEIIYSGETYKEETIIKAGVRELNLTHQKEIDTEKRGIAIGAYVTFRIAGKDGTFGATQVLRQDSDYFKKIEAGAARNAWKGDFGIEMWKTNRIREVRKWIPFGLPVLSGDDGSELDPIDVEVQPALTAGEPGAIASPQAVAIDEAATEKPKSRRRRQPKAKPAAPEQAGPVAKAEPEFKVPADDQKGPAEEAPQPAEPAKVSNEDGRPYREGEESYIPPEPASEEVRNQNPGGMGLWDDD